jgi:zinc protease
MGNRTSRALISLIASATFTLTGAARAEQLACETVERYTLANGLEVVLQPDRAVPLVAVVSSVHAGSRNDPPAYSGLAHYVEHLLFREGGPFESAFNLFDGSGATVNARTTPDTTDYHALLPSEQLERGLWIEARRLGLGLNIVEESTADLEKQVVLREHSQRGGFRPAQAATQALFQALFPEGHPYHSLLSTADSIEAQSLASARWFYAEHYRLARVRLIVVGDFEPAAARELIERHYGGLTDPPRSDPPRSDPPRSDPPRRAADSAPDGASNGECRWAKQAVVPGKKRIVQYTRSRNESLQITWPLPPGVDPETLRPALNVIADRVADRARELDLSHRVGVQPLRLELAKLFTLAIDVMPGQDLARIEPLVWEAQAELAAAVQSDVSRKGTRRSSELLERLNQPALIERALKLTARECAALQCAPPSGEITSEQLAVFGKANALVFEARYGRNAPPDGSLEVSP